MSLSACTRGGAAWQRRVSGTWRLILCAGLLLSLAVPQAAPQSATADGGAPGIAAGQPADLDLEGVVAKTLSVPMLVHEILPPGAQGLVRQGKVVTFGVPFALSDGVKLNAGRPALAVKGATAWQFRDLALWPGGQVRWALCDALVDVPAGGGAEIAVIAGSGASAQPLVAHDLAPYGVDGLLVDTGPMRALVMKHGQGLIQALMVYGSHLLAPPDGSTGIVGRGSAGQPLVTGPGAKVALVETGPLRAVLRADGSLVDTAGKAWIDYSARMTVRRGSPEIDITLTVRNATSSRWNHAVVRSVELVLPLLTGDKPVARVSTHASPVALPLAAGSRVLLHVGQTTAEVSGLDGAFYLPHLPKLEPGGTALVQRGYRLVHDEAVLHDFGNPASHPDPGWIDLAGSKGGATASIRQMAWFYPAALEARGDGRLVVGLFTAENPAPYTFILGQHESRSCLLAFHTGAGVEPPAAAALRNEWPLGARAKDYLHYDRSDAVPYRLVTPAQQEWIYSLLGLDHQVDPANPPLVVTRYLGKSTSGPANNHDRIERLLAGEWLRHGHGGAWLNAVDLALYKTEWQVRRSDDHVWSTGLPTASNEAVPHTQLTFGDDEHRYREGLVLAYHLTGDERIRAALHDEAEILKTVTLWPHERSMYQTLRALATLHEFTGDAELLALLRQRLAYVTAPILDVANASSGFGWDGPPGEGSRRYFAFSGDLHDEKPPGENFQARGWISASLGPLGYGHAARVLPLGDPLAGVAWQRLTDLAFWTRHELFPHQDDPADARLVHSYAVSLAQATEWELYDFHPILYGMAHAYVETGDIGYLVKGAEQILAFAAHDEGPEPDNLHLLDTRLDCQEFFAVVRDLLLTGVAAGH